MHFASVFGLIIGCVLLIKEKPPGPNFYGAAAAYFVTVGSESQWNSNATYCFSIAFNLIVI